MKLLNDFNVNNKRLWYLEVQVTSISIAQINRNLKTRQKLRNLTHIISF